MIPFAVESTRFEDDRDREGIDDGGLEPVLSVEESDYKNLMEYFAFDDADQVIGTAGRALMEAGEMG